MRTPLIDGKAPGQFKARCALTKPHPLKDLPEYLRREYAVRGWKTGYRGIYSRKLRREVDVECYLEPLCDGFETTDRAVFEAHMKTVHGRKAVTVNPLARLARSGYRGPRLTEEGTEFPVDGKTIVRCECGLYGQLDGTYASELWWREHTAMCAEKVAS